MSYPKKKVMRPGPEQIERLREKLHLRISLEELESSGRLGALDFIVNLLGIERATLHRLWIVPLLDAGLSLEGATACILQSYFQPN